MAKIKTTTPDSHFSKCIREAAGWKCECCGTEYPENAQGLHCSHFFGRRAYGVRFDPDNAFAHCFGCHSKLGGNPYDFHKWAEKQIGAGLIQILREKREDTNLAKYIKKNLKSVSDHYREELKRLKQLRAEGAVGKLKVQGFT